MSIVYGWSICEQFLAGGHDLDCHFVETNPRHNLPVLLALTDVWNDTFFGQASSGRIVTPFSQAIKGFPSFVAALEAQACSSNNPQSQSRSSTSNRLSCSSLVLDGGSDSAYDRALYESSKIQYSELVMVMNTQLRANTARTLGAQGMDEVYHHADALICSLFGHADEMAFGETKDDNMNPALFAAPQPNHPSTSVGQRETHLSSTEGNRPSTLLICGKLDAYACGQLIALSEHRAAVKARIWDIDPFTPQAGYNLKTPRTEQLREDLQQIYLAQEEMGQALADSDDEEDKSGGMSLSTKTILGHYARVRS
jgi:glucose-6-phosphate isomerase